MRLVKFNSTSPEKPIVFINPEQVILVTSVLYCGARATEVVFATGQACHLTEEIETVVQALREPQSANEHDYPKFRVMLENARNQLYNPPQPIEVKPSDYKHPGFTSPVGAMPPI